MPSASTTAAEWLSRGQTLEAAGDLTGALAAYDSALALFQAGASEADPVSQRDLAVACMNRGNALQKQVTPASLTAARDAYDQAIALLQALPLATNPSWRNSLGAAWMNHGLVCHRQAGAENLAEAVCSHREAIGIFRGLPRDQTPWYRTILAGALMNLGNALLDSTAADHFAAARTAAQESLAVLAEGEISDPVMIDLELKARRVLCDALGHLLVVNTTGLSGEALADEAGDVVDEGLALVRRCEPRLRRAVQPLAERLFYFGAQLYRIHQPHFLAEFLLEHVDPARSPGALPLASDLEIAAETITHTMQTLRARQGVFVADAATDRQVQTLRDLKAAELRLAELRASPALFS